MPDGVTTHSPPADLGVADTESAGGGAALPVALLSAVFVLLSAVQALRMTAASVNGGIVRTLDLSGWNGPSIREDRARWILPLSGRHPPLPD
jgi:hypothetical protein